MLVAIDCDGVLADFAGAWLDAVNVLDGTDHGPDTMTDWDFRSVPCSAQARDYAWRMARRPGFAYGLRPLPGAADGLASLRDAGYRLVCVTSPLADSHSWCHERAAWLKKHMGFSADEVVFALNKNLVAADVLVDDSVPNVDYFDSSGRLGILWDAPYNRDCLLLRASSWAYVATWLGAERDRLGR